MKPQDHASQINVRSSALRSSPAMPVMKARRVMGPLNPGPLHGQGWLLIAKREALAACALQRTAHLVGLFAGRERPDRRAVHDLAVWLHALDHGRVRSEHR